MLSSLRNLGGVFILVVVLVATSCNSDKKVSEPKIDTSSLEFNKPATPVKQPVGFNKKAKADQDKLITGGMKWSTFDDLPEKKERGSKKYLIDVYTTWCGWCKILDKKTFTDPQVQKVLRENFHIIKFDAERKESVYFDGAEYSWMDDGKKGINSLAPKLLGSRLTYPTLVYLDEDMKLIKSSPGYKNPEQLLEEIEVIIRS